MNNPKTNAIKAPLELVIKTIKNKTAVPRYWIYLFRENIKNGSRITIVMARSLGFHLNPVGVLVTKNNRLVSLRPKSVKFSLNGEMGILKFVKISKRQTIISIAKKVAIHLKTCLKSFSFSELNKRTYTI